MLYIVVAISLITAVIFSILFTLKIDKQCEKNGE